jgi:ABC-type branched-subunit amino acid transport system ATPase component
VEQKPSLKIVGVHVEGLRALRRVDWPADGNGWNGIVPEMVMVGGVNGSGKTTLLELIADAVRMLRGDGPVMWSNDGKGNAWVDLLLRSAPIGETPYRVLLGDAAFVKTNTTPVCTQFVRAPTGWLVTTQGGLYESIHELIGPQFSRSELPRIVYFPTDRRLEIPAESFKVAGRIEDDEGFACRFRAAREWKDSLGALLYGARWADLNAKEEGHPERATHFESYARAFQFFFGEAKRLTWHNGELFVEIADTGALHPLMELSSGEKQALILAAELYRRWRPGSLILIDEPELHFHTSWQTTLWTMLEQLQKERGGQVIVATQSTHLFRIAAPKTTVLLGGPLG